MQIKDSKHVKNTFKANVKQTFIRFNEKNSPPCVIIKKVI